MDESKYDYAMVAIATEICKAGFDIHEKFKSYHIKEEIIVKMTVADREINFKTRLKSPGHSIINSFSARS